MSLNLTQIIIVTNTKEKNYLPVVEKRFFYGNLRIELNLCKSKKKVRYGQLLNQMSRRSKKRLRKEVCGVVLLKF